MYDSDSSALSSAPASDDERLRLAPIFLKAKTKPTKKKAPKNVAPPDSPASPPRPPRSPSPPHQESLADHPDIAFLVMFRSRFSSAFPPKMPHLGPQDIERGIEGPFASPEVEGLLCALLGIALNRKKPVERGHHGRALEDALASQRAQWPRSWNGQNPTSGGKTFNNMLAIEKLDLLRTLVLWSLSSSEVISQIIKDSYKQNRHEDDRNQPLSVQPWGVDGDKRRYWLVEGQDDTSFRLYRESPKTQTPVHWWNVAGNIDEIKAVADKLETKDTTQAARRLATGIMAAIPRFEATEEKRRRREYRQMRRAQFARPEPGFSLYEGRTRGKRMRYTFEDDDMEDSDDTSVRRSGRHSDRSTPAEAQGPVVTASGRQVRARGGGLYGESLLSGQVHNANDELNSYDSGDAGLPEANGMDRRSSRQIANGHARKRKHIDTYNVVDQMSDEEDAASSAGWNSADNEDDGDDADDFRDDGLSEDSEEEGSDAGPSSLVVKLKVAGLDNLPRPSETQPILDNIRVAGDGPDAQVHDQKNGLVTGTEGNGEALASRQEAENAKMDWTPVEQRASDEAHDWIAETEEKSAADDRPADLLAASAYRTPSSLAASETKLTSTSVDSDKIGFDLSGHPSLAGPRIGLD